MVQASIISSLRPTDLGAEEVILEPSREMFSETELVERSVSGDEDAFREIVKRFGPRVFRTCGKFFRRYSLIEEASQETFLRAFTQLPDFEGRGSFEGWITRVAATTCINILRTHKRQSELLLSEITDEESNWFEEARSRGIMKVESSPEDRAVASDLIEKIFNILPHDDVLVLVLTEVQGASLRETSEITGWTESKVKVKAFRARKKMRKLLEDLLSRD